MMSAFATGSGHDFTITCSSVRRKTSPSTAVCAEGANGTRYISIPTAPCPEHRTEIPSVGSWFDSHQFQDAACAPDIGTLYPIGSNQVFLGDLCPSSVAVQAPAVVHTPVPQRPVKY